MRSTTAVRVLAALAATSTITACGAASGGESGDYPNDTIELIVGTSAGGPTDTNARILASCMEKDLGETIVVKNVDGASGAMGNREVIAAKPDGYTLSLTPATGLTLSPYLDDLGFSVDDVTPIGKLFGTSMVFFTKADASYQTGEEFLAEAKENPGEINVGTPGPTSPKSVVMDALRDGQGIDMKPVPLEGQSGVVTALLGGNVDVGALEATDDVKPYVESGEFVPLAAISPERVSWLPDTPTLEELGYPDGTLPDNEYPLYGPKGLPDDVASTLESAMKTCVEGKETVEKIGADYATVPFEGSEETKEFLEDSAELYQGIVE
jgi:tripartite-type tricarboxylate transporter receptor subunit TctC